MSSTISINVKNYGMYEYEYNANTTLKDILDHINNKVKPKMLFMEKDFEMVLFQNDTSIMEQLKRKGLWNVRSFVNCVNIEHLKAYLLEFDINIRDGSGNTVLVNATSLGELEVVKFLVGMGANIEIEHGEYLNKNTPLNIAVCYGEIEIVEFLVGNGANVETENHYDNTPLYYAASKGYFEIFKFLVRNGANFKNDKYLSAAISNGHPDIVRFLVKNGANIEILDAYGNNLAMEYAKKYDHILNFLQREMVKKRNRSSFD